MRVFCSKLRASHQGTSLGPFVCGANKRQRSTLQCVRRKRETQHLHEQVSDVGSELLSCSEWFRPTSMPAVGGSVSPSRVKFPRTPCGTQVTPPSSCRASRRPTAPRAPSWPRRRRTCFTAPFFFCAKDYPGVLPFHLEHENAFSLKTFRQRKNA